MIVSEGSVELDCMFNDTKRKIKFQIIISDVEPIFGAKACTAM